MNIPVIVEFTNRGIVYSYFMPVCGIVKTTARGAVDSELWTARCTMAPGRRPRAIVHRAVHGTEGSNVLLFHQNSNEITVLLPTYARTLLI